MNVVTPSKNGTNGVTYTSIVTAEQTSNHVQINRQEKYKNSILKHHGLNEVGSDFQR